MPRPKAATGGVPFKKAFFKNSQENICVGVSFLIKLQVWGLQLYLERDPDKGVSLLILQYFKELLLW